MRAKSAQHYGPIYVVRLSGYVTVGIHARGTYLPLWSFKSSSGATGAAMDPLSNKHRLQSDRDLFAPKAVD